MKKYLLMSVAALAATAGYAQVEKASAQKMSAPKAAMQKFERGNKGNMNVLKSYTNQTYYLPQGTYYAGWDKEGKGIGAAGIAAPPFTDLTFKNMMAKPTSGSWAMNGKDASSLATEEGNFMITTSPNGMYYAPTLINGQYEYTFGENNYYYLKGQIQSLASAAMVSTTNRIPLSDGEAVLPYYAMNDHGSSQNNSKVSTNTLVGYGFLEGTGYLFGAGSVTGENNVVSKAVSAAQIFNAPGADLYIEDFFLGGALSFNLGGPISGDQKITAYIINVEEVDGEYQLGKETIATFAASVDGLSGFASEDAISGWSAGTGQYKGKSPYHGTVTFYNTDVDKDPLTGAESPKPVVIPAGKPFAIVISGLDQCDLGMSCIIANDEDNGEKGMVILEDGTSYSYQKRIGIRLGLDAIFEKIYVPSTGFLNYESEAGFPSNKFHGWNVLRVSNDGQTVDTDELSGTNFNVGAAFVGTSTAWVDDNDTPYYDIEVEYVEGGEGWITGYQYDDRYYDASEGLSGYNMLVPTCEALPAGVKGRAAKITVYGRGDVKADNTILVLQGDIDYTAGIDNAIVSKDNANTSNRMFNLSGQEVGKNYKGVVVKNGKKFLNK